MKFIFYLLGLLVFSNTKARPLIWIEAGPAWQTRNVVQIPGQGGTRFLISDFDKGPVTAYRAYLGYKFNERHELRFLWAPFSAKFRGSFTEPVIFQGTSFAQGTPTEAYYKFNSYRLTYAYHFDPIQEWELALGFTAKVRDAEIRLTQGTTTNKKANVGFVPLLNFQAHRPFADKWGFRTDIDGLAASQGRAIDAAFMFERQLAVFGAGHIFKAGIGYRTLEGGADNKEVYNFAWLHYLALSLRGEF